LNKINLIIADDNKQGRFILRKSIEDIQGINIFEAENGKEAVELAKMHYVDIVLMDYMMPEMDGLEATKQIMMLNPDAFIIIITADDSDDTEMDMLSVGAVTYLTKPINAKKVKYVTQNYFEIIRSREDKRHAIAENECNIMNITKYDDIMGLSSKISDVFNMYGMAGNKTFLAIFNFLYDFLGNLVKDGIRVRTAMHKDKDNFIIIFPLTDEIISVIDKCNFYNIVQDNVELSDDYFGLKISLCGEANSYNIHTLNDTPKASVVIEDTPVITPTETFSTKPQFDNKIDEDTLKLLRRTHEHKISAEEFVAGLSHEVLQDVETLEEQSDHFYSAIYELEKTLDPSMIHDVTASVHGYERVLGYIREFSGLGFALGKLSGFLSGLESKDVEQSTIKKMCTILYELEGDLRRWKDNVFINREAQDVHYLDSSMLSSCLQIQMIVEPAEEVEEDLEFF